MSEKPTTEQQVAAVNMQNEMAKETQHSYCKILFI